MKALMCNAYGPPEQLALTDIEKTAPGAGEVSINVAAAAINFPDLLIIAGQYQVKIPPPFVPGLEAAGVVDTVGQGVTHLQPGDRVMVSQTQGAFSQHMVVKAREAVPTPPALTDAEAASFLITYSTAYHGLHGLADLKAGDIVLVLGAAGGVGSAAIEIAKAHGAQVIAAASTAEKCRFAESCGADETLNYSEVSLKEELKVLTVGRGVDVVFDPVGGDLAQQALRATAWHGRYLVVGFASGEIPSFPANMALLKEASITGVWWGTWAARQPDEQMANLSAMATLIAEGKLKPRVSDVFPLESYVDAFAQLSDRKAQGKVVLDLS